MATDLLVKSTYLEFSSKLGLFTSNSHNKAKSSTKSLSSLPTRKNRVVQIQSYSDQIHVQKLVNFLHECSRERSIKEAKAIHGINREWAIS
ncbi:unnamed protein product [Lactuca virosa]|uniref:Uncharacterized protein n=1 Tax=Lactuca virosa TaxID=75947 RepID=A0AAU9MW52_9ASTR|nr:unnamed protein product [Lactuca virosa]